MNNYLESQHDFITVDVTLGSVTVDVLLGSVTKLDIGFCPNRHYVGTSDCRHDTLGLMSVEVTQGSISRRDTRFNDCINVT